MADSKSILLRISRELWEELQGWAHDELRSVNAQMEYLLREAVRKRRGRKPAVDTPPDASSDSTSAESLPSD